MLKAALSTYSLAAGRKQHESHKLYLCVSVSPVHTELGGVSAAGSGFIELVGESDLDVHRGSSVG